jgi:hypothetical protein
VRLYDRETDESAKAFDAWTVYRDLGAERSLQKASEMYYGHGRYCQKLWIGSSSHAATFSLLPSTSSPFTNFAPALTRATK